MRTVKICKTDISLFSVVVKSESDPAEKTAAEFLQRVIKASCGVELPIVEENAEKGIYLGFCAPGDGVKYDGFRLFEKGGDLYLDGNLARGTLYAAYGFAEKFLGWRAFAPDCEVISDSGEAEIPLGFEFTDSPVFEMRHCDNISFNRHRDFASFSRINGYGEKGDRLGGNAVSGIENHTFEALCPPAVYFDEHPEYYSLYEGKRIPAGNVFNVICGQLCLTNPEVLKIVTDNVLKKLRNNPGMRVVDVSQNDNDRYCQCENCARVDAEEESHAGTMIRFVNAVAEAVEKEFPDVLVQTFAYSYTRKAPKLTRARHNVLVRYCTIEACFRHAIDDPNCAKNSGVFCPELKVWGQKAEALSIWDYIVNYLGYVGPFPNLVAIKENVRFYADCHAIHLFYEDTPSTRCGAYGDLRAYLAGKVLWDPYMSDETYENHIVEFLKAYYGPGWRSVAEYIRLEHGTTADVDMNCFENIDISNAFTAPFVHIGEYMAGEYLPKAYQAHHPDTFLKGFIPHIGEALELWNRAYDMAETDTEREHIALGRLAVEYVDLFNTPHDKKTMSDEEKAAYEKRVAEYFEAHKKFGLKYNIRTVTYNDR